MPLEQNIHKMMGRAVGISLRNGQGTSGILCDADNDTIYVTEYLYHDRFVTKQYAINMIQNILPFPPCTRQQRRPRHGRRLF